MPTVSVVRHRITRARTILASAGINVPDDPRKAYELFCAHEDFLASCGVDPSVIPAPAHSGIPPGCPASKAAWDYITAPGAGEALVFDGSLDSLRGVPLTDLDGVGEGLQDRLQKAQIQDVWDLLMRIPRKYIDRSVLAPLNQCSPGETVTFIATVSAVQCQRGGRGRTPYARFTLQADGVKASAMFFQAPWMAKRFSRGDVVLVHGDTSEYNGYLSLSNPLMSKVEDTTAPFVGLYPQSVTNGVSTWDIQRAAVDALRRIPHLDDPTPSSVLAEYGFPSRLDALRFVHAPGSLNQAECGRQRLVFDELFRLQLALGVLRHAQRKQRSVLHSPTGELVQRWMDALPYRLTNAQQRAISEIHQDLAGPRSMNRLLQGDVGAGKTAVITAAALMAVESGHQAVIAVPAEILARQHYNELQDSLGKLGISVDLLVSKKLPRPRKTIIQDIASSATSIIVGTHAVLSEKITYRSLGLVIVDEQHRFGVDQRSALAHRGPGGASPDVLQATATPIPRTSAITEFGDMDVSVLDEKPAGRKPIDTRWTSAAVLNDADADCWEDIRNQAKQGRQSFVVCPLVMATSGKVSETKMAAAAQDVRDLLAEEILADLSVGLVHGKQAPEQREEAMRDYQQGRIDVLVATTVIEVGVSIPNATVMVILEAGRFGIAQLHQLRGRVGRGSFPGRCWLTGEVSGEGKARMEALCSTNDGFRLSELDLQIRGPGSLVSSAQAGKESGLVLADLVADHRIHAAARQQAQKLLAKDPDLSRHLLLRAEVQRALGDRAEYLLKS